MKHVDWFEHIFATSRIVICTPSCASAFATSTSAQNRQVARSQLVLTFALAILLALGSHAFALDKHKAAYVGGTLTQFSNATDRTEGRLDVTDARQLQFTPDSGPPEDRTVRIDYAAILDLELRQKVNRRLATTIGAAALAGPFAVLTPSKRRHYLTITYVDDQRRMQVLMLELGDELVRPTLTTLEQRSGKPIEFRDEASRKWNR